jgi:hypothetical protein
MISESSQQSLFFTAFTRSSTCFDPAAMYKVLLNRFANMNILLNLGAGTEIRFLERTTVLRVFLDEARAVRVAKGRRHKLEIAGFCHSQADLEIKCVQRNRVLIVGEASA